MKRISRFARRALSLMLCLAMVMTTMFFFDIGITKPQAAVSDTPVEKGRTLLIVPEVIYLKPQHNSWTAATTSTFDIYVENTPIIGDDGWYDVSPSPDWTQAGNVYFSAEDGYDSSSLELSCKGYDSSYVSVGGSVSFAQAEDVNSGSMKYTHFNITGGTSPSLAAATTGYFIEWTLSYKDSFGEKKSVVAYTYVYKPFVRVYGGAVRVYQDGSGNDSDTYASHIGWVSGVHSIGQTSKSNNGSSNWSPSYTVSTTAKGMAGFISSTSGYRKSDNASYVNGVSTYDPTGVKNYYLPFATDSTSTSYMWAGQANHTVDGQNPGDWFNNGSNMGTSFTYYNREQNASSERLVVVANSEFYGNIYVDTSRYTNLGQIPNLGVGLLATDDDRSTQYSWYVADGTGTPDATGYRYSDYWQKEASASDSAFSLGATSGGRIIAGHMNGNTDEGTLSTESTFPSNTDNYCGLWYTGNFPVAIKSDTSTYSVKTFFGTKADRARYGFGYTWSDIKTVQDNKAALRAKVTEAMKKFGQYGVILKDSKYGSYYYSTQTNQWQAFVTAYRLACMELTKLDGRISSDVTIQNRIDNLTSAMKNLEFVGKLQGDAFQYNVGLMKNRDGSYRVVEIPQAETHYALFTYGDKLEFTADTFSGYTYKGMLKLDGEISVDAVTKETKLASLPSFTSDSNRANHSLTIPNGTLTITNTGNTHPTTGRATINGSTVTYPSVTDDARVSDGYRLTVCYIYFYEITDAEVLFGNEFDFDHFNWSGTPNQADSVSADRVNNTVTLNSKSDATDAYTTNYSGSQPGYMTLIPGRTYEFSCSVKNNTAKDARASMFLFSFPSAPTSNVSIGTSGTDFTSASTAVSANGTASIKGTLKIPEGRPYATLCVGTPTAGVSISYSDIVVRDITTFTTPLQVNDVTKPNPISVTGARNSTVTNFQTLTRPGYQFAGWSTVREANGNGAAANIVTTTTVPANGNRTLYPVWQTNVIYELDGGIYRKSSDSSQTSYQVEGRWNLNVGTSVPVSNKVVQGDTGWNSADVSYTYVPYKPGYNFKGWKAESVDPSVNGKVYWPTDVVVANANVEFTAVWEAATAVTFNESSNMAKGYVTSSQNNMKFAFYPGQVHFFSYTAPRAQYASAYTS
ncbi:MAG: hypothetical protein UH249_01595, partial [Acutalibacteraceae bacterium]|nr:hypothetical protein [Acutalibacteraceae bacterium]